MSPPDRHGGDERRLLDRLRKGDEAALASLIDEHHASLRRLARTFLGNDAAAEEVVQDTWLAVLEGLASFEGRSTLKTWIFRILTNHARTRGARDSRMITFSALATSEPDVESAAARPRFTAEGAWADPPRAWEDESPEQLVLRSEIRATVEDALAELPPNQRVVMTLRDIEGLDAAEVCNVLEISETNQRVLLHRARSRVRAALEHRLGIARGR